MMNDLPSNSNKNKRPVRHLDCVVKGKVATKKKSPSSKLKESFIPDNFSLKDYILYDLLIPNAKKMLLETLDTMFYPNGHKGRGGVSDRVSYRNYNSVSSGNARRDYASAAQPVGYSYDEVLFDNRGDAEGVMDRLLECVEQYGIVSVADFFDLCGQTPKYTDYKYGWTDLRSVSVVRVNGGQFAISLPKAMPI